ncbi:efflux RND transporter permease subunit [Engelhardtia mirabilis]|uniref:Cobalt-zinc-cadmium resistance protein CzcA n=1 Tax=Engelhardtia mirabilis TaxID=2528011 RepID=A0A518BQB1_9BACT|nr:Cobalt-zinc-cadmium resistance protein CzcA [Planctomycetes bacterium Pla133]QDV03493.1 Cobalt-zinc-cadmium resistance protein CzcA [Planctomycetes bacterium Pla86]
MNPVEASVRRPYTVAVAVLLLLIFSALALTRIPIQLKPTVEEPRINVTTTYRGASALEVEEEVTRELEEVLQNVEGLTELASTSADGLSTITLEFSLTTDTQLAVVDVINKLSQVPRLPEQADEPVVQIASANDNERMMWLACESAYDPEFIQRIVEQDVESRLERVTGVSDLLIAGGAEREIQVRIDPELLVARGLTVAQVANALTAGNLNVRGGTVETEGRQWVVRTIGRAARASELGDLIVARTETGSVRMGEIAEIRDTYEERTSFVKIDGKPGIAIGVGRQTGANVVDTVRQVEAARAELNERFRQQDVDLHLATVYSEITYIDAALAFVTDNLILGSVLAVSVLLMFLRSPRSILIVALSIPISLAAVFLVLLAAGKTLNVISLAGIAFASGMVVDNAIVVLENIFRHLEMGKGRVRAAIDGGREVWGGVLASTLTTVAVFVPILIQRDEASQIFGDMALAIAAAVVLSLVVSLTVVPVLAALIMPQGGRADDAEATQSVDEHDESASLGLVGRLYGGFLDRLTQNRFGGPAFKLGVTLILGSISLLAFAFTPPAEYLPGGNRNLVMFFAEPIPGTRPEAVRDNFVPFEQFLMAQPESARMFAVIASRFNGGGVVLKDQYGTGPQLADFHRRMFGPAFSLPGFNFVVPIRSTLFRDPGKQFEVELSGPDIAVLEDASARLQGAIGALDGVQPPVRSSLITGKPELVVEIDERKAKDLGLDVSEIGRVIETVVAGRRITRLIEGGREVEVNLVAAQTAVSNAEELERLRFYTDAGRLVTLGEVASVTRTTGPQSIRRLERQRSVLLTVNLAPDAALETAIESLENDVFPVFNKELGSAYSLGVGGSADKLQQTLSSLSAGFGLSVLIIYLLLVSLFRSWLLPGVILVTVPLALSGGIVGIVAAIALTGGETQFDVLSMLGFVILAGLVVNNAILIVHQANNFELDGIDKRRALSLSAQSRLRPILMSVITTVTGMVPLALGGGAGAELYQGLASILVGGLVVSTLFTLFLVPVILSLGHDLTGIFSRGARRRVPVVA